MNIYIGIFRGFFAKLQKKPMMFFDWEKAALLIKEHQPVKAVAGLKGDFEWTGAVIYRNGHPILIDPKTGEKPYTFLGSNWAKPLLVLTDHKGCDATFECYTTGKEKPFRCGTYWPREAIFLL